MYSCSVLHLFSVLAVWGFSLSASMFWCINTLVFWCINVHFTVHMHDSLISCVTNGRITAFLELYFVLNNRLKARVCHARD